MTVRRFVTHTATKRPLSVTTGFDPYIGRYYLLVENDKGQIEFNNLNPDHWPQRNMQVADVLRVLKTHLRVPVPRSLEDDLNRDHKNAVSLLEMTYPPTTLLGGN